MKKVTKSLSSIMQKGIYQKYIILYKGKCENVTKNKNMTEMSILVSGKEER